MMCVLSAHTYEEVETWASGEGVSNFGSFALLAAGLMSPEKSQSLSFVFICHVLDVVCCSYSVARSLLPSAEGSRRLSFTCRTCIVASRTKEWVICKSHRLLVLDDVSKDLSTALTRELVGHRDDVV
ncbi:unnamed protein product [Ectocarpus sp. 12 AP-2014]